MSKGAKDATLELQAIAAPIIAGGIGGKHLQRDEAIQGEVAGEIDVTHSAMPEQSLDDVATDSRTRLKSSPRRLQREPS